MPLDGVERGDVRCRAEVREGDARVTKLERRRVGIAALVARAREETRKRATMGRAPAAAQALQRLTERSQRGLRTSLGGRDGRLCMCRHRAEEAISPPRPWPRARCAAVRAWSISPAASGISTLAGKWRTRRKGSGTAASAVRSG